MNYQKLYKAYQKLLAENQELKNQNLEYRKQLGLEPVQHVIYDINTSDETKNTQYRSPDEKIALFMSLFRGRDDVYAKRWTNKKGQSGYSPVCLNEWVPGVCAKPKKKCMDCSHKDYKTLGLDVIEKHLRGKDVYGVYPMLPDETCYH